MGISDIPSSKQVCTEQRQCLLNVSYGRSWIVLSTRHNSISLSHTHQLENKHAFTEYLLFYYFPGTLGFFNMIVRLIVTKIMRVVINSIS